MDTDDVDIFGALKEIASQWDSDLEKKMFDEILEALGPIAKKYTNGDKIRGLVSLHTIIGLYKSAEVNPDILAILDNEMIQIAESLTN